MTDKRREVNEVSELMTAAEAMRAAQEELANNLLFSWPRSKERKGEAREGFYKDKAPEDASAAEAPHAAAATSASVAFDDLKHPASEAAAQPGVTSTSSSETFTLKAEDRAALAAEFGLRKLVFSDANWQTFDAALQAAFIAAHTALKEEIRRDPKRAFRLTIQRAIQDKIGPTPEWTAAEKLVCALALKD